MEELCCVHSDRVHSALKKMPRQKTLYDLAELYKMFGDSTGISILCALLDGEMCVGDIAALLSMGQSAISHQLRLLRSSGLVRSRRNGKTVYYSLADSHVHDIFSLGLEHVTEKEPLK